MSFLKSLFGRSTPAAPPGPVRREEHEGFVIEASPMADGGQYLVCGTISKEVGGERREHRFIRADRCPAIEDAADMTIRKGKQIIDQMGERIFG